MGHNFAGIQKKMLALPCPRPRPDALPEPGGSGRTWGGAGLRNLAFLISVLRLHLLTVYLCLTWGPLQKLCVPSVPRDQTVHKAGPGG